MRSSKTFKKKSNPYIIHEADDTSCQILSGSESVDCDTDTISDFIDLFIIIYYY